MLLSLLRYYRLPLLLSRHPDTCKPQRMHMYTPYLLRYFYDRLLVIFPHHHILTRPFCSNAISVTVEEKTSILRVVFLLRQLVLLLPNCLLASTISTENADHHLWSSILIRASIIYAPRGSQHESSWRGSCPKPFLRGTSLQRRTTEYTHSTFVDDNPRISTPGPHGGHPANVCVHGTANEQ